MSLWISHRFDFLFVVQMAKSEFVFAVKFSMLSFHCRPLFLFAAKEFVSLPKMSKFNISLILIFYPSLLISPPLKKKPDFTIQ